MYIALIVGIALFIVAMCIEPVRKAIGLVMVVAGIILMLSVIGFIVGLPMLFMGGLLLFVKGGVQ